MFKNTFQSGFLSILYSIGSKPLQIWDKKVRNGHIKRITDNDIQSLVLEIVGTNVSTTYITCPADPKKTLGIKLPFLVMIIKNLKKYFTFEVQVSAHRSGISSSVRSLGYIKLIENFLIVFIPLDFGRQKCEKTLQSEQLSIDNASQAVYLHNANATG